MISLRPIRLEDKSLWQEMRKDLYGADDTYWQADEIDHIKQSEDWHCFFITEGEADVVIGLAELSLRNIVDGCYTSPVPYLEGLYLLPTKRGMGYGEEVLRRLLQWAKQEGYQEFGTDAEADNTGAIRFYHRLGFKTVDTVVALKMDLD